MKKFKVWYIPQVPMHPFETYTDTAAEAWIILNVLYEFSNFEYANRVKPDYSDAGGVAEWDADSQTWDDLEEEKEEGPPF